MGTTAKRKVTIAAPKLDKRGMVRDFTEIKHILQAWIDQNLDHRRMILE